MCSFLYSKMASQRNLETLDFDDFKQEIQALFPNQDGKRWWSWRDEPQHSGPRSLVLEFDARAFADAPDESHRAQQAFFFQRMIMCRQVALVVTNLIDIPEKEKDLWTAKSLMDRWGIHAIVPQWENHHKCFKYQKIEEEHEGQQTGFPYEYKGNEAVAVRELMKDYQTCDEDGSSGDSFYYLKDISFKDYFPDLIQTFREKSRIPEIFPGGKWCLLDEVCSSDFLRSNPIACGHCIFAI